MFCEFELGPNIAEESTNLFGRNGDDSVDHDTVTKWLKKFRFAWKKLDD